MSRTRRKDAKEDKELRDGQTHSLFYRRERKWARKETARELRRATHQALQNEEYDELPEYRGTGGWLSY